MSNRYVNPSGFAENLPAEQLVEERLKAGLATAAEGYGYVRLETPAIEYMDTLASEGNITKEIYRIVRSQAEDDGSESERGLHFDLTIPFARYVAQHYAELPFPFRRFQIQKVWRGERPQKGRFREFYQADIDVVANEVLPIQFDAEVITVIARVLSSFNIGPVTMKVNNRKFLTGLLEHFGITDQASVLQQIDKLDKIGVEKVSEVLMAEYGIAAETLTSLFTIITSRVATVDLAAMLIRIPDSNETLVEGKAELLSLFENVPAAGSVPNVTILFDPAIARGLDYYTGMVCETIIDGFERYGSICSGGRYADLASRFTSRKLPGVGLSIGLSRLMTIIKEESLLDFSVQTKTQVIVGLFHESLRALSHTASEELRAAGVLVETVHKEQSNLGKQIDQAAAKGVPFVLACEQDGSFSLFPTAGGEKQICQSINELVTLIATA